ncbi:hypothetical protein [Kribbella antibiotica]|uniref:hypothetical protein n=1 Tax=Kribbella antibiotica TaxID=190195 RepID=UPI00140548A0|nr:hypothetical protein [Kribbella antibiotica]
MPRFIEVGEVAYEAAVEQSMMGTGFSTDGRTMFFNVYNPGITYAITGPWRRRR